MSMHPVIAKVIDIATAAARARVHEVGYSNSGVEVNQYLAEVGLGPGFAWCAAFACWCLGKAGGDIGFRSASCPEIEAWAARTGVLHKSGPQVGDWCLLQEWDDGGRYSGHIGLVTEVHSDGTMETIEGNTSSGSTGSQTDGGGVYRRTRYVGDWWFVRWVDALRTTPKPIQLLLEEDDSAQRVIDCRAQLEGDRLRGDVRPIADALGAYIDTHLAVGGLYLVYLEARHVTLHVGTEDGHPLLEQGRLRADVRYVAERLGYQLDTSQFSEGVVRLKWPSP